MTVRNQLFLECIIAGMLVFIGILALVSFEWTPVKVIDIPQCEEDAVIVGVGDFEDGRWDSYKCGPSVDDYVVMPL